MRNKTAILVLLILLFLCGCSGRNKYEPFTPLSKATVSPEREAALQAAANGGKATAVPTVRAVPTAAPTDELHDMPNFDEDAFFSNTGSSSDVIKTEVSPFDFGSQPDTAPTAAPSASGSDVYNPNVNMYGTSNGMTTYILQEGDDLLCLGRRFDVSMSQLLSQNGFSSPAEAKTGDEIILPRNPNPWSLIDGYGRRMLKIHPTSYTVQSGDTLFSIACAFGDVRPEDIALRNQLVLGAPLVPGSKISIP